MSPGTENGLKPIAPFASQKRRWDVKVSKFATNTVNPIREIVDNLKLEPNPDKQMIALSIGELYIPFWLIWCIDDFRWQMATRACRALL